MAATWLLFSFDLQPLNLLVNDVVSLQPTKVKCDKCLRAFSQERYFKSAIPPRCGCGGLIRPDIVLFGETLPEGFQKLSKEDFQTATARGNLTFCLQSTPQIPFQKCDGGERHALHGCGL